MGRPEPEGCRAPQVPEGAPDPLPRGDPDGARPGVSRRAPPPLREGGRKDPLRRAQAGLQGRRRASLSRRHLQGTQAGLQAGPPQVLPLRPPRTPLSPLLSTSFTTTTFSPLIFNPDMDLLSEHQKNIKTVFPLT